MNEQTLRKHIAKGIEQGVMAVPGYFVIWVLVVLAVNYFWPTYDDSDDAKAGVHSEMKPLTDHLTGCQYLRVAGGGVTPRLAQDGRQICTNRALAHH